VTSTVSRAQSRSLFELRDRETRASQSAAKHGEKAQALPERWSSRTIGVHPDQNRYFESELKETQ
jgi:hypothetical protein